MHCRTALKTKSPVWEKRFHFNINDAFSVLKITVASEKMNSPLVKFSIYHLKKNLIIILVVTSMLLDLSFVLALFYSDLFRCSFCCRWTFYQKWHSILTCSMFRWWWDVPCFASPAFTRAVGSTCTSGCLSRIGNLGYSPFHASTYEKTIPDHWCLKFKVIKKGRRRYPLPCVSLFGQISSLMIMTQEICKGGQPQDPPQSCLCA